MRLREIEERTQKFDTIFGSDIWIMPSLWHGIAYAESIFCGNLIGCVRSVDLDIFTFCWSASVPEPLKRSLVRSIFAHDQQLVYDPSIGSSSRKCCADSHLFARHSASQQRDNDTPCQAGHKRGMPNSE